MLLQDLCKRGPSQKALRKGLQSMAPKKNMKAMKAMKVKKAHLKRPSADLDLPKKEGMSLEEKMELFIKKGLQLLGFPHQVTKRMPLAQVLCSKISTQG